MISQLFVYFFKANCKIYIIFTNFTSPRDQSEDTYELAKASTSWMGGSSADNSFEDEEARNNSMGGGMSSQLFVYILNITKF